jgi:hypothetical protein
MAVFNTLEAFSAATGIAQAEERQCLWFYQISGRESGVLFVCHKLSFFGTFLFFPLQQN